MDHGQSLVQGQILDQGHVQGQGRGQGLFGVVASGFARWSMSVCVWLHLASPDVSVDSADGASSGLIRQFIHMSLTTRIHSSNQASTPS